MRARERITTMQCMSDPRYPIGEWQRRDKLTADERAKAIETIAGQGQRLRDAVAGLSQAQLDTPYRDGGWTVRQVVHHVPDSHMNAYIRTKLAVAENHPRITAYNQDDWVKFADAHKAPIAPSLALLENLHVRWVQFLRSLSESAFERTLDHPENGTMLSLIHISEPTRLLS